MNNKYFRLSRSRKSISNFLHLIKKQKNKKQKEIKHKKNILKINSCQICYKTNQHFENTRCILIGLCFPVLIISNVSK